jgi:Bifunctional DNA primase/polymerase, N-terminal
MESPSFSSIAAPFIKLKIPVFPLLPGKKEPATTNGVKDATLNPDIVAQWSADNHNYNVGIAALAGGEICFLEFDVKGGLRPAASEMEQELPETRLQASGRNFAHYVFTHTERSRKLGNRKRNLDDACYCDDEENRPCLRESCKVWTQHHHHEWFSFRANNEYLVGAGSTHPNGRQYTTVRDVAPIPVPDWVCDWIEKNFAPPERRKAEGSHPTHEDFDFDETMEHYGIRIHCVKDDVWHVPEECMGVGHRHEHSVFTAFYWDGEYLGWNCFAQGCPLGDKSIGGVIEFLNAKMIEDGGEPYRGVIWNDENEGFAELAAKWKVRMPDSIKEFPFTVEDAPSAAKANARGDNYTEWVEETVREQKEAGDIPFTDDDYAPVPHAVAIEDPNHTEGMEFPGDSCMYGKLAKLTKSHPRLQSQLGWLYPSHLAVASALPIEDAEGHVRSNLYMTLLGESSDGKTACMKAALASIQLPFENSLIRQSPGSHSGLLNLLDEKEPKPFLLALNELKTVLDACAIQGSRLPQMLCTMWEEDGDGDSVKRGVTKAYGKLSVLGGLVVKDSADFGKHFGSASVTGMADRFLLGYSTAWVAYIPAKVKPVAITVKPVHFADWVWGVKNQWLGQDKARRRMSEQALRVALVTAAVNGDTEITPSCLEAAFRFCEWQLRLRQTFKPGLAETKEAECLEGVYNALNEAYNKQMKSRQMPEGAEKITDPDFKKEHRWKLLDYRAIVNSKSYYRTYAGLLGRVKKLLIEDGIIEEYKEPEPEEDDRGKKTRTRGKKSKTPFVLLQANVN